MSVHVISVEHSTNFFCRVKQVCRQAKNIPHPELILAAGHSTHIVLLYLARKTGARSVVIMKPSLPMWLFDDCLIPEHDFKRGQKPQRNVILTHGALNRVRYESAAKTRSGLILIGGASKEFSFDGEVLRSAICEIVQHYKDIEWVLTDSRRTREGFLEDLEDSRVELYSHQSTGADWLPEKLRRAAIVWVTEDSVSMIYEALSSGAKVGLLPMSRVRKTSRVSLGIETLHRDGRLSRYKDWQKSHELLKSNNILAESDRVARLLLMRLNELPDQSLGGEFFTR